MAVGAKAVALGTALFRDPSLAKKLRTHLPA
jgi:dihydroorotate dehydrogenase